MKNLLTNETAQIVNQRSQTEDWSNNYEYRRMKMLLRILELFIIVLLMISAISAFSQNSIDNEICSMCNKVASFEKVEKFTAVCNTGKVYLNWIVKGETTDCVYIIERSNDGSSFETVGVKEGIGSPLELLYSFIDVKPLQGITYYRLKKLDSYGVASYSEPSIINNERNQENKPLSLSY